jgi:hypothetical protein
MRILTTLPALALIAAACSSGGNQPGSTPAPETTNIVHPGTLYTDAAGYNMTTVENKTVYVATVLAPPDSVWQTLPGIFLELGIEPKTVNTQEKYIGNSSVSVRHTMGKSRVSKYLDCGRSNTSSTADQAEVTLSLIVQVVPEVAGQSSLHTQFSGYAMVDGSARNRIQCASTGVLEAHIADMVKDELTHRAKN